jgi:ABC-type multidrug transport system fused ATPase/permease subunit/glycosyltransferase involved in cell wall biosynthesis
MPDLTNNNRNATRRAVAYVLKGFPRLSEMFIASEIYQLEQMGLRLKLYVLIPPDETMSHEIVDRIETQPDYLPATTSLSATRLPQWLRKNLPKFLPGLVRVLWRHPRGTARAAGAALFQSFLARRRFWSIPKKQYVKEFLRATTLADRLSHVPEVYHLHAHFSHGATTVTWLASLITGLPFSFTAHAKDIYCEALNPAGLLSRKMDAAEFVVTCTEANRKHLQGLSATPVHCVYHGLNADFSRLLREQVYALKRNGHLRVLAVGRLVSKKGFDTLIEACAILKSARVSFDARIVGESGEHERELRNRIARHKLEGHVHLVGPKTQAQLLREYQQATVFCLPCRVLKNGDRDGIPNVLMEAMSCGLPVVTTDVSGIPELIRNGVNGLLVRPDDPAAIARALQRLFRDPLYAESLGIEAVKTITENFDGERTTKELARLFGKTKIVKERYPHSVLSRLLKTFGPDLWAHRGPLAWSYFLRTLAIGAALFAPWPLKLIIDHVITSHSRAGLFLGITPQPGPDNLVLLLTGLFLLVTVCGAVANSAEKNISARIRERLTLSIRDRLLAHLQTLAPTFRNDNRSGELVLRLVDDSDLFVRILTKTLPLLFQQLATLVLSLAVMFVVDVRLGLLASILVPVLAVVCRHYSRQLWTASGKKRRHEGKVSGLAQEIVRGMPVIQALGSESYARSKFKNRNAKRLKAGVEETRVAVRMERMLQIIQGIALALVTGGGALLAVHGQITIGELTLFTAYIAQLLKPIEKLNDLAETSGRGFAGGERLLALLEQEALVQDSPGAIELHRAVGVVEFRDVWFEYPDSSFNHRVVLRGIDLRLKPGRLAVLQGESGAGKSTILSLLVRLFDPTTGEIHLDGVPLRQLKLKSLRSQVAIMTQELHLFSGTLRSVLMPTGVQLSDASLWDALSLVALEEFVRSLPHKLDTPLGEDGLNLSGGQRQRLSLARAFLLDRPILLLDEPLANVDAASAAVILKALDRLRAGKTCLAITHESTLLKYADDVYCLKEGRIVDSEDTLVRAADIRRRA